MRLPERVTSVATPKVVSAKCPTCGANLPVPPGAFQVTCRYCQNVIQVEHRKPPPEVRPFGTPGAMPSRTLYVDPTAAVAASKKVGLLIGFGVLVPFLLPLIIGLGPVALRLFKGTLKPYPIACGMNERITVSGDFEGTGPIVTSAEHNCKLHIKNGKLKGSKLLDTTAFNIELTLENVTIETTEPMIRAGSNLVVKVKGSTLTAPGAVFDSESNMEIELEGSSVESKNAAAIKSKHNLKVRMDNGKVHGKKAGFETDSSFSLTMKNGSEISASDGPAIKTASSFNLDAEGGKIDGGLVMSSNGKIEATGLTITSKERAIAATSSLTLDYNDGSITSEGDAAIDGTSSLELTLTNTKVQGATAAIVSESNVKIKASKKTAIIGLRDNGITTTSNSELNLTDATVQAGAKAFKGTVNDKLKLGQGARLIGQKGGIEVTSNVEINATGATLDGGSGPGLAIESNARVTFKQGSIKGTPALRYDRKPTRLELDGTRIEGGQKVPAR